MVKHFGPVKANDGIDLAFAGGEIHAVLGENGAGKSTLIKVLAGIYHADAGTILLDGEAIEIETPLDAKEHGIAFVHQQSALVPRLSVLENVTLLAGTIGWIDPALARELTTTAEKLGFTIDPAAVVESLSVGDRQRAEIARALMGQARFVILDEPTSVLAPMECDQLFALLARVAASGVGVIVITHHLEEVVHCHRISVLRNGRVVATGLEPSTVTEQDLIRMMVGELVIGGRRDVRPAEGSCVLRAQSVAGAPTGGRPLKAIDLDVHAGEVLGIAGVEGNGQRELSAALTGTWRPPEGTIELEGRSLHDYSPAQRARLIGDIPDDEALALSHELSTWENLLIWRMNWESAPTPAARGRFRCVAAELVRQFEIKTASVDTPTGRLSGGNRRRVQLARELSKRPSLLVATYPTKGLDVRSTEQVKEWIRSLTETGSAVVYIGSDLEELLEISDRVAVLVRGRVVAVLDHAEASIDRIGALMLVDRTNAEDAA